MLPGEDTEGIWAIGLVPSTRTDHWANARYLADPRTEVHIYSYPPNPEYRLPAGTRRGSIETGFRDEREFGMAVEEVGSRWVCRWDPEGLRRFVLNHVLPHGVDTAAT